MKGSSVDYQFNQGRRTLGLGVNFAYREHINAALLYTWYADGAQWNPTRDRDYLGAAMSAGDAMVRRKFLHLWRRAARQPLPATRAREGCLTRTCRFIGDTSMTQTRSMFRHADRRRCARGRARLPSRAAQAKPATPTTRRANEAMRQADGD